MPTYEQNRKSAEKYLAKFRNITFRIPKDSTIRQDIKNHARITGETMNDFILRAIQETMSRDAKKAGE